MKKIFLLLAAIVITIACSTQTNDDSPVVASVGKSQLSINDIETMFYNETGVDISNAQVHRYVQRWIEKELIYREAVELGLKENPEVQEHLLDLEKDYLVNRYIDDYNNSEISITEQQIASYYNNHLDDFIRKKDLYNLRIILVENYRTASTLRREVNGGSDFSTLAKDHSLDGSAENGGLLGWTSIDELDDELSRQIPRLSVNQISSPIKTEKGYFLLELLEKRPKNEVQTLEEVKTTVINRLRIEKKREIYENLISELGEKYVTKSNFEILKKYNRNGVN